MNIDLNSQKLIDYLNASHVLQIGFYKKAELLFTQKNITIHMYKENGQPHQLPHINIRTKQDGEGNISLEGIALDDSLSKRLVTKLSKWVILNRSILEKLWNELYKDNPNHNEIQKLKNLLS